MSAATLSRPAGQVPTPSVDTPLRRGLDVLLEEIVPGEVLFSTELRGTPRREACTAMLDLALAAAVQSVLTPLDTARPVSAAVIRSWPTGRPHRLEARASVVRRAGRTIMATGAVHDDAGRLVATGRLVARQV